MKFLTFLIAWKNHRCLCFLNEILNVADLLRKIRNKSALFVLVKAISKTLVTFTRKKRKDWNGAVDVPGRVFQHKCCSHPSGSTIPLRAAIKEVENIIVGQGGSWGVCASLWWFHRCWISWIRKKTSCFYDIPRFSKKSENIYLVSNSDDCIKTWYVQI